MLQLKTLQYNTVKHDTIQYNTVNYVILNFSNLCSFTCTPEMLPRLTYCSGGDGCNTKCQMTTNGAETNCFETITVKGN